MSEIQYMREMPAETIEEGIKEFERMAKVYSHLVQGNIERKIGSDVIIEWACIWNTPKHIGKRGTILMTDGRFCVVGIKDEERDVDFFRCCDVMPIKDAPE